MDLNEVKYTDLNKQSKTKTVKDMQRAAHSQGYDMSDPKPVPHQGTHFTVDLTHRKTGKKVTPSRGVNLGGAMEKGGTLDNTLRNRTAETIKQHAKEIGRVDKRPKAKSERKAQAAKNKARKQRDRDPFTRKRTFEQFMYECNTLLTNTPQ
jgi:ribosomal protein S10